MDLSTLDTKAKSETGARLYFDHPDSSGNKLDVFMDILGRDSKQYNKSIKEKQLKIMNKKITTQTEITFNDLMEAEEEDIDTLVSLVVGLGDKEGDKEVDYITCGDKQLKCTKKDVTYLLTQFVWMREQVSVFMRDRANFL